MFIILKIISLGIFSVINGAYLQMSTGFLGYLNFTAVAKRADKYMEIKRRFKTSKTQQSLR